MAASGTGTATYTHAEAVAKAQADLIAAFTENATAAKASIAKETEYKETFGSYDAHIPASFYTDAVDMLVADYTKYVNEATSKWMEANPTSAETNPATISDGIKAVEVDDIYVLENNKFAVKNINFPADADAIKTLILKGTAASTDLEKYYQMQIWASALDTMKSEVKAEIAKVDMSLYTDDVISDTDYTTLTGAANVYKLTWKAFAEKTVAEIIDAIDDTSINPTKDVVSTTITNIGKLWPVAASAGAGTSGIVKYETVTDINSTEIVISYKLANTNIKTAKDLKGEAALDAAQVAADKAAIQSVAADLLQKALNAYNTEYTAAGTDAAKKVVADNYQKAQDVINAWVTVNTYLVEEGNGVAQTSVTVTGTGASGAVTLSDINGTANLTGALAKADLYETAQDQAAAAKIAVDKDGALKYDAAVIDSNLAKLKEKVFDGTVTDTNATKAAIIEDAEAGAADTTPWHKEVAVAQVKKALENALYKADGSDKYYDIEKAKVQAKYDELIAKIEAATTEKQLKAVLGDANYNVLTTGTGDYSFVSLTGIVPKGDINNAVKGLGNFEGFVTSVNTAVDYLNWGLKVYEDGYRAKVTTADDKTDVAAFLAKNGVRTYTDLAAKASLAKEYAESLPTNGQKKAAQTEFDAMIKALPTVVTFADKDQVAKAWAYADENGLLSNKLDQAVALVKAAEKKEIDKLFKVLPTTITVADKEAVKAAIAAEDAYEATAMYDYETHKDYTTQFEALRAAEKAAVEKQIALLPADTSRTELDAAKAAVDAFVAEYRDAAYGKTGYEAELSADAANRLSFAEAYATTKEIKAVESLKVKISTKAYKGYIKVSWTTIGEAEAADGYQIYRSTKATSAGKKIYTTKKATSRSYKNSSVKKGTKYYYKVRAFKVVDGVTYYSDWSSRGIRTAK